MVLTATTHAAPNLNNQASQTISPTSEVKADQNEVKPELPVETERPAEPVVKQELVSYPKGCEHYADLISKYSWNKQIAVNVMRAESGCNPYAVGDTTLTYIQNGTTYGMSCGLFQVRYLPGRPTCEALKNPAANVDYAYRLYTASGWKPWSVCRTKISCY
jgi:hypothetical protein